MTRKSLKALIISRVGIRRMDIYFIFNLLYSLWTTGSKMHSIQSYNSRKNVQHKEINTNKLPLRLTRHLYFVLLFSPKTANVSHVKITVVVIWFLFIKNTYFDCMKFDIAGKICTNSLHR